MPSMGWLARGKRSKYIEHHEEARAEATKDADWCSQARGRDRLRRRPTTQREGWGGGNAFPPAAADGRGWLIRMVRPEWSFRRPASKLFRTRAAAAAERAKLEAMIEQGKTQFAAWRQWLNGLSCRRAEIKQPPSGSRRLELTNRDGVCLPIPVIPLHGRPAYSAGGVSNEDEDHELRPVMQVAFTLYLIFFFQVAPRS